MIAKSSPRGWLKLFLILALLGGIGFFLDGIVMATHSFYHSQWAMWSGGILMAALAGASWRQFARRYTTAVSLARCCIIIFLMLSVMFIFCSYQGLNTSLLKIIAFIVVLVWADFWWLFLARSKQVKELPESQKSKPGIYAVIAFALICVVVSVVNYVDNLKWKHQVEMWQMEDRLQSQLGAGEMINDSEEIEDFDEIIEIEAESSQQPSQVAEPEATGQIVSTKDMSFLVPEGFEYKEKDGVYYLTYDGEVIMEVVGIFAMGADIRLDSHIKAFESNPYRSNCERIDTKEYTQSGKRILQYVYRCEVGNMKVYAEFARIFSPDLKYAVVIECKPEETLLQEFDEVVNSVKFK